MDNTRVITPPNATPFVMAKNNKMLQNKTTTNLAHSVPMYPTMNGRQGAQIFMNAPSVMTATKMHFTPPPQRAKSSNDINLTHITASFEALQTKTTYSTITTTSATYFAKANTNTQNPPDELMFKQRLLYSTNFGNHNTVGGDGGGGGSGCGNPTSNHSKMLSSCDSKLFSPDSPTHAHESSLVGGRTLLKSLKGIMHSMIKPIIDAVSADHMHSEPSAPASMATSASVTTATNHKSMPSPPTYCDKQNCTDSFCRSIESQQLQQPNVQMAYANRECEFFDCDDYIEGGEDTIDFVADSTKFVPHSFGDEFAPASTKDSIYYDCLTKSDTFETPEPSTPPPPSSTAATAATTAFELPSNPSDSEDSGMENTNEINIDQPLSDEMTTKCNTKQQQPKQQQQQQQQLDDPVQYGENGKPTTATGPSKSNRNAYRRKQRGRRKQNQNQNQHKNNNKSSNKYGKKGCASNKNRHEKQRHEIEMNLHDDLDIENCSFGQEEDFDLEIIDLDVDERSPKTGGPCATAKNAKPKTTTTTATTTAKVQSAAPVVTPATTKPIHSSSVCIETPIPSPEKIESNCIFTRFFPFKRSSSLQFINNFKVPPLASRPSLYKGCHRAPAAVSRVSESESDDSFIVFEDVSPRASATASSSSSQDPATYQKRTRQLSECSDDFILFEDGGDDACLRYDTTDEDFYLTDSTDDDSDSCSSSTSSSDDESSDESDTDHLPATRREIVKDNQQPDSGFEEKKVRFNLCPKVHEIRAWKFAYSQARKGQWEQMGRDRGRFEKRINDVSRILSPILAPDHRRKIYEQRFHEKLNEGN